MTNYRYLIILMAVVSAVVGEGRFKSKFRPRPEWFEEAAEDMPRAEALAFNEEQQYDQPETHDFAPYPVFMDSFEAANPHDSGSEGGKFQRTITPNEFFDNLCPFDMVNVSVKHLQNYDSAFEYKPEYVIEYRCKQPFHRDSRPIAPHLSLNRICEKHDNKCIQLKRMHYFTRRPRETRTGVTNNNCWMPTVLPINSDCQCMWPKNRKGDILKAHLSFDDDE